VKAQIARRFHSNLDRVRHLLAVYGRTPAAERRTDDADLLRAAVVFLHATLEDLVRSVLEWRLPAASPESLKDVPLVGLKPRSAMNLADLAPHRGQLVDAVIANSVQAHLERSNFNDPGEVERALASVGLSRLPTTETKNLLGPMIQRRHLIVHRADRPPPSRGPAPDLDPPTIELWLRTLETFGADVLHQL
jgi:hypothetical protein